jgi:hypothetical protein
MRELDDANVAASIQYVLFVQLTESDYLISTNKKTVPFTAILKGTEFKLCRD